MARNSARRLRLGMLDGQRYLCFVEQISRNIDVPLGMSAMQAALNHRVEGILDEWGGNRMCATCHVSLDSSFLNRIPPAQGNENFVLSIAAEGPEQNSRLICRIQMTEELDGIAMRLHDRQQ